MRNDPGRIRTWVPMGNAFCTVVHSTCALVPCTIASPPFSILNHITPANATEAALRCTDGSLSLALSLTRLLTCSLELVYVRGTYFAQKCTGLLFISLIMAVFFTAVADSPPPLFCLYRSICEAFIVSCNSLYTTQYAVYSIGDILCTHNDSYTAYNASWFL